jgi:transportin-1
LASDSSAEIRKRVCGAIVLLVEVRIDYLLPHIRNVVQYMLFATQDSNEEVALEACEFWSAVAETQLAKQLLGDILPRHSFLLCIPSNSLAISLIPVLLNKMIYADTDDTLLYQDDDAVPDQPKDIKPFFHTSRARGSSKSLEGNMDDEDGGYEAADDEAYDWNLRKCSAAGLDILSNVFQDTLLPVLLPLIQEKLNDKENWKIRETAILALGAIAEGCSRGMKTFLPQLVPFLINCLSDSNVTSQRVTLIN